MQGNPWLKYGIAALTGYFLLGPGGTAAGLFVAIVLTGLLGGRQSTFLAWAVKIALAAIAFIVLRQYPQHETGILTVAGLLCFAGVLSLFKSIQPKG